MTTKQRRRPRFLWLEEEAFFNRIESSLPYDPITDANACTVFPEGKKILTKLLKDTKHEIDLVNTENLPKFDAALDRIFGADMDEGQIEIAKMLAKWWHLDQYLDPLHEKVKRYERILRLHSIRDAIHNSPDEVNELTISSAKEVRLEDLIGEKPNHAGFIRCPFHNEKTASCKIQKNRFHCFGCGADGDVIDWVMKTGGRDFLSAVRELTRSR